MRIASSRSCVLVFVRSPQPGKVKTRLGGVLSDPQVLDLYMHFAEDVLAKARATGALVRVCYHPPDQLDRVAGWLGNRFALYPQQGENLGHRMKNSFTESFADGFSRVILIGTDIPDLPRSMLKAALAVVSRVPAVIGPALDGGYYLVGFHRDRFFPEAFEDIPWGTAQVLCNTLERFAQAGLRPHLLPPWRDVDDPDDFLDLIRRCSSPETDAAHTVALLTDLGYLRPWKGEMTAARGPT